MGNNAFLVLACIVRRKAAAGRHMQPVRGTLPSDRRKSCPEPQSCRSRITTRDWGLRLCVQRGCVRASGFLTPFSCWSRGSPSQHWPLRPFPPLEGVGSSDGINRNFAKQGFILCLDTSKQLRRSLLWPVGMDDSGLL